MGGREKSNSHSTQRNGFFHLFWSGRRRSKRSSPTPKRNFVPEPLEARRLLTSDVLITEFMASNDNGIRDQDHNRPDWVELLNTTSETMNLNGWFLTDDADDLDKWELPDIDLAPHERTVVFASEKNLRNPNAELHTNFALNLNGDYLALVQPDGITVAFDYGPEFSPQLPDVSYGIPQQVTDESLVNRDSAVRTFVPNLFNGGLQLGRSWTEVEFDAGNWQEGSGGVGYETTSGYEDLIGTDVKSRMFNVNASIYLRHTFDIADPAAVFSLTLNMQYDDGYVAYINGQEVARRNAPDNPTWNSEATDARRDTLAVVPETVTIDIFQFEQLLHSGENVLAIQALNNGAGSNDFLIVATLEARVFGELQIESRGFFAAPTPGEPNGLGSTTSFIEVAHEPNVPNASDDITVRAETISTAQAAASEVMLHYRVMFADEISIPMHDDGLHKDGAASDGVFAASIPANLASHGQMIRYRVTASEAGEEIARRPIFTDPVNTEEYFGLVISDDSIQSRLPVFHLFVEDTAAADTIIGTTGSLFHDGQFYDNIEIDTTGRTVGLAGPKKSHDVFFTSDHWLELQAGEVQLRMNDFDIISDFWNRTKLRIPLAYQTLNALGTPAHLSMPVRVQQNGEFFGTFSFVDGGNEQFVTRAGLNPNGALYKMNLGFSQARGVSKKHTRTYEDNTDLREFFSGLALQGDERVRFLMDNINIPATANYLAGLSIVAHGDCCNKNLYIYRDTEGTGEWEPLPWDVDSAFGRGGVGRAQNIFVSGGGIFSGSDNVLFRTLYNEVPGFRSMYLRRLRTLMDEFLQPSDTPQDQLKFEKRIDEMVHDLAPDAALDFDKWGSWVADPQTEMITYGKEGEILTWQEHVDIFRNEYFPARRTLLYNALRGANGGQVLEPQLSPPKIDFGQVESNPASGNQDEEFIELKNNNGVAVDISDWQLTGGVQHTFHKGTVIPPGGSLYVSPNVNAFRARADGPSGGQGLFVQGAYRGHISNHGAAIGLVANDLSTIDEISTAADPTREQQFLRISEVMYHPRAPEPGSRFVDDDYEFVELVNTSTSESLNLHNLVFTSGIPFTFPELTLEPGARTVVVRDAAAFTERYGSDIKIAGEYGRTANGYKLSNGGETVTLEIAPGDPIQQFTYSDRWIRSTDGTGFSLTIRDAGADLSQWNLADGWQASKNTDGSPGTVDSVRGDLNSDHRVDLADVDLLCGGIQTNQLQFDLTNDAKIDIADLTLLIQDILGTDFGDANLDGVFDSSDLVSVFQAGEFEDEIQDNSTWAEGDWNCDGDFGTGDLVTAFQAGGFVAAATKSHIDSAAAVDDSSHEIQNPNHWKTSHAELADPLKTPRQALLAVDRLTDSLFEEFGKVDGNSSHNWNESMNDGTSQKGV